MKRPRAAAILATAALLAGCSPFPLKGNVAATIVSRHGPYAIPRPDKTSDPPKQATVFAAIDLASIRRLACGTNPETPVCWPDASPQPGSILIAVYGGNGCATLDQFAVDRVGSHLVVRARSSDPGRCSGGQGSAALSPMVLLAVPARGLPSEIVKALPISEPDGGAGPIEVAGE